MRGFLTFIILFIGVYCYASPANLYDKDIYMLTDSVAEKRGLIKQIYRYFENANKVNKNKDFDISYIGGPYYSNESKLGVGLLASALFSLDRSDLSLPISNLSLYGDITTSGYYKLGIMGNTFFPKKRYRLDADLFFFSMPSRYWGIGYDNGKEDHNYSKYTKKEIGIKLDFLVNLMQNLYVGVSANYSDIRGIKFIDDSFLNGERRDNKGVGGGLILAYDSRDFIPNPYNGIYLKIEQLFFPHFLGSSTTFNRTNIVARLFLSLSKGTILAYDLEAIFNNGQVPWTMCAQLGSAESMRGYFEGQYRDKKLITTQLELRQNIYKRHGIALWAGAGNIFSDFSNFEWSNTLPNFGVGYRWEFKHRVNIRFDYGVGKGQSGFYFNINEAF